MNKKHILMSALILSSMALTSCDDFLDTSSKTKMNSENCLQHTGCSRHGSCGLLRWMAAYIER